LYRYPSGLEKYLMTKLYPRTFAAMGEDQRVDHRLAQRIAALRQGLALLTLFCSQNTLPVDG
jgi:hypothetical protein